MRPRRSRSIRKFLRVQKAKIRREVDDLQDQERRIRQLLERFPHPSRTL